MPHSRALRSGPEQICGSVGTSLFSALKFLLHATLEIVLAIARRLSNDSPRFAVQKSGFVGCF